ncbi:aspartyl-phosphate phosphatase Spo0E family protein [Salipaludibacillus daqingensis]|uniref:aspartyl-phosphate phosphatase Spo0E family protein n=1 Tax=Salipaludibacillus daqingensis TaxID=3041001 RepID=UPI002473A198|nr:aspartyl-phosphate phosphatase Spo0E family protein [Salipaludibacillus daqingensis]
MVLKQSLKSQMEAKRQLMIVSANKYGFTSSETIRYSQELDQLMNVYRRITQTGDEKSYSVKDKISCTN